MTLFSDDQLKALVEAEQLDPRAGSHAIIGTVDAHGAQVVASMTFHGQKATWEIQAVAAHTWDGDNTGAAKLILQW